MIRALPRERLCRRRVSENCEILFGNRERACLGQILGLVRSTVAEILNSRNPGAAKLTHEAGPIVFGCREFSKGEPVLEVGFQISGGGLACYFRERDVLLLVSLYLNRAAPTVIRRIEPDEMLAFALLCASCVSQLRTRWPGLFLASFSERHSLKASWCSVDLFGERLPVGFTPDDDVRAELARAARLVRPQNAALLRQMTAEAELTIQAETRSAGALISARQSDRWHLADEPAVPGTLKFCPRSQGGLQIDLIIRKAS